MTEFASFPDDAGDKRIVYVREVKTADLPEEVRARTNLDHLYAILAEFDLRVFQNPSGRDLQILAEPERAAMHEGPDASAPTGRNAAAPRARSA